MKNQFVTYEIALKLKELGFDEECFCTYHNAELSRNPSHKIDATPIQGKPYVWKNSKVHNSIVCAPLWQQVIDYFRDKYHTNIEINRFPNISKWGFIVTDMTIIPKQQTIKENINMSLKVTDVRRFDEYFECREQAILKAIELI